MAYIEETEEMKIFYAFEEVPPGLYEEADRGARVYLSRRDILPNFRAGGRRSCYIRLDIKNRYGSFFSHLAGWTYERAAEES